MGCSPNVLYDLSVVDHEAIAFESDTVADAVCKNGVHGVCTIGGGPGGLTTVPADKGCL